MKFHRWAAPIFHKYGNITFRTYLSRFIHNNHCIITGHPYLWICLAQVKTIRDQKRWRKGSSNLTIWSLMVFPSCSTVRIFCKQNAQLIAVLQKVNLTQVNQQYITYKINSNCADIAVQVWVILITGSKYINNIHNLRNRKFSQASCLILYYLIRVNCGFMILQFMFITKRWPMEGIPCIIIITTLLLQ